MTTRKRKDDKSTTDPKEVVRRLIEHERQIRLGLDELGLIPISHAIKLRPDISRQAIYQLVERGTFDTVQLLGRTFVYQEQIDAWEKGGTERKTTKRKAEKLWWRPDEG